MLFTQSTNNWPTLINLILNAYFSNLTTICILYHNDYDFRWPRAVDFNVYLSVDPMTLNASFAKDVYNYSEQDVAYMDLGIPYDDWIKKLMIAIQMTFCEGFVVFQDDIPKFAEAFRSATLYSRWRSMNNRFLFLYSIEDQQKKYFEDLFFKNYANILIIEAATKNASLFSLKTNKFIGSFFEKPHELIELTKYDAIAEKFQQPKDLFPMDKLQDLQGREIIVGAFDYRPFVAVDYQRLPQYHDYADDNPSHLSHVDGTEIHIVHTFCKLYNCTVQVDTSEKAEWGTVFPNFSGDGLMGMILDGKTHMGMGAMYSWDNAYRALDETTFLGRSGVTCLVPAPKRITSWTLPLRPFQFNLWLGVWACLCIESLLLLLARQFEQKLVVVQNINDSSWWSSIQFGYITTLKLFVSQGSDYVVNSHTVRTVLFACYMIDIIITSIYGGGLAAILTMPTVDEVADSVERLYKHNLTWSASSTDWVISITPTNGEKNDPIYERLLANFHVISMDEAREQAKTENIGFVLERMSFGHFGNGEFITPEALDRLKLMVDDIYFQFTVAIVPRLWAHLPKYNNLILLWHSSGFDKYWEWKIVADYMNAHEQNQVEASKYTNFDAGPVELDMKNFAGLLILWIIGTFLSIVVFFGELIFFIFIDKI